MELLKEAGIAAHGVEQNRISIEQGRERGFEIVDDDAIAHLRALPDRSVAAVTGFHIIEHVPIDALITLR